MTSNTCVLAIDQGTTSSRAIVFNQSGQALHVAQQEFSQIYPHDGWVEHDPEEIWSTTLAVTREVLQQARAAGLNVAAIGITNQRETTLVWDRKTGKPLYNAIVWQDRRTSTECQRLREQVTENFVRQRSGLLLDPYFSATKVAWILDNVEGARERAGRGELAFGTVDTFLIWRLTAGRRFVTDITNASRTNLFNIHTRQWDPELLQLFRVPGSLLPEVLECTADFGTTDTTVLGDAIPILGVAGDQQAATVGQCCFDPGTIKSTYGTGCFMVINTGAQAVTSNNRLLTTIAYTIQGTTHYALEGSIFVAGAAVQWLRDSLGIIETAAETEALARTEESNEGVYFVPALTGLGAPHWDPDARGAIFGLTRASGPAHIARAALESVCYQTHDLLAAVREDGIDTARLRVDGGMVANNWLMQFMADILDAEVDRPAVLETTALGAAYLAGLQLGLYSSMEELQQQWQQEQLFQPDMNNALRDKYLAGWHRALGRTLASP
ncbi:glycerol kinase GlpK [Pseudomaricurvus sp. HS19]|uniref:glycerol kinase GlpK n=1 Tax=Pseudomaricurvus sp. HS19 TaxID=2692626 RepID=UPI001371F08C|nr:glycerol kinase GlpK [Pseudomaricurvus sp. HS19]MYM63044.1 glycerol kinase GlpK [Pseudomaricurvus sp. HS19]